MTVRVHPRRPGAQHTEPFNAPAMESGGGQALASAQQEGLEWDSEMRRARKLTERGTGTSINRVDVPLVPPQAHGRHLHAAVPATPDAGTHTGPTRKSHHQKRCRSSAPCRALARTGAGRQALHEQISHTRHDARRHAHRTSHARMRAKRARPRASIPPRAGCVAAWPPAQRQHGRRALRGRQERTWRW